MRDAAADGHTALEHLRAAALVAAHGSDSLDPFALRADKRFHFAAGGGARVGLEDGIYLDRARTQLATNARLVERVHHLLDIHERRVMTPDELRERLTGP